MLQISNINPKIYLSGGIVIGCLILIDALMIFGGYQYFVNQIFSLMELCWFVYSSFELFRLLKINVIADASVNSLVKSKTSIIAPLTYILYYLFGFFIASYWLAENGNLEAVPDWYVVFAMLFGAYYVIVNVKIFNSNSSSF